MTVVRLERWVKPVTVHVPSLDTVKICLQNFLVTHGDGRGLKKTEESYPSSKSQPRSCFACIVIVGRFLFITLVLYSDTDIVDFIVPPNIGVGLISFIRLCFFE